MSTWGHLAITLGNRASNGAVIDGNTVYNTRNGVVARIGNTVTISNNIIYDTKGGIMNYTSNQEDADNRTMSNNSWTTAHNEWDIVWNTAHWVPNYQFSVLAVSSNNNSAYVLDRRAVDRPTCAALTGNRSHIFVNIAGSASAHPAKGNFNEPFATIALGIAAVVPGGTVYVAAGTYDENVTVNKSVTLLGANADNPCGSRDDESVIAPASGVGFNVEESGVTINGFEVTAPGSPNAIVCGNTSDLSIVYNNIHWNWS